MTDQYVEIEGLLNDIHVKSIFNLKSKYLHKYTNEMDKEDILESLHNFLIMTDISLNELKSLITDNIATVDDMIIIHEAVQSEAEAACELESALILKASRSLQKN